MAVELLFEVGDGVGAVVEDGRGQRGVGFAFAEDAHEIVGAAGAAGCDHGDVGGAGDGARQVAIEALLDAVGIHRGEQNLAGAELLAARGPLDGVDAFVVAAAAGEDVPCAGRAAAGVDGQHDGLRAEFEAQLGEQLGAADGGGVDRDFVGAGHQDAPRVGDGADAAADRERDENFARGAGDDVGHDGAGVARGGDVEEDQLVGALPIVAVGQLDRIAGVAQVHEVDAFDHAAAGDVETGDDSFGQHQSSRKLRTICRPTGPDFSGWNCTPKTFRSSRTAV